jgi:hypothetical protein
LRRECLGEAEIQNLHNAVVSDLDVGRFQISMDDALLVRRFECAGDLSRDGKGVAELEPPGSTNHLRKRAAGDELHDQSVRIS